MIMKKFLSTFVILPLTITNAFHLSHAQTGTSPVPLPDKKPALPEYFQTKSDLSLNLPQLIQQGVQKEEQNRSRKRNNKKSGSDQSNVIDNSRRSTQVSRLSLSDIYTHAYHTDSRIGTVRNEFEASEYHARADLARTWGPQLAFVAGFSWRDASNASSSLVQMGNFGSGSSNSVGISLSQPIFNYQQILQTKQSKFAIALNELRNVIAQQDLMTRIVKSYLDILKAEISIEFKDQEYQAARTHLEYLEQQLIVEPSMIVSVEEARARLNSIEGSKKLYETNLAVAKGLFLQTWGIDLSTHRLRRLKPNLQFELPSPNNVADWAQRARESNLVVQHNKGLVELAKFDIQKARAALYMPVISGTFNYSRQENSFAGIPDFVNYGYNAGINVTIPLADSGYTNSKTKELVSIRESIRYNVITAQNNAVDASNNSFFNIVNGLPTIESYQEAVEKDAFVLDGKKEFFQYNLSSSFEVLVAVRQLNASKQQLIDEQFKVLLNKITLLQAAGTLSPSDLRDFDSLFE